MKKYKNEKRRFKNVNIKEINEPSGRKINQDANVNRN